MELVYLRFNDNGEVNVMHVLARKAGDTTNIFGMAEKHGFTPTARLVEYHIFELGGPLKSGSGGSSQIIETSQFRRRWELVEQVE